jgi:hypothetical protein
MGIFIAIIQLNLNLQINEDKGFSIKIFKRKLINLKGAYWEITNEIKQILKGN